MFKRWQDWMNVLLGFWLVISPWEIGYSLNKAATGNGCGLGAALIFFNLIAAARLLDEGQEIFNILLGLWLVVSPYSLDFAMEKEATLNAVAVGAAVVALASWQIYDANRAGKR